MATKLSRHERTADIRTIFQRDDNCVNPDTEKIEKGNWCTVCKYVLQIILRNSHTNSMLGNGVSIGVSHF
jgi:hypothetical protein